MLLRRDTPVPIVAEPGRPSIVPWAPRPTILSTASVPKTNKHTHRIETEVRLEDPKLSPNYREELNAAYAAACRWPGAACVKDATALSDDELTAALQEVTGGVVLAPALLRRAHEAFPIVLGSFAVSLPESESAPFDFRGFVDTLRSEAPDNAHVMGLADAVENGLLGLSNADLRFDALGKVLLQYGYYPGAGPQLILGAVPVPPDMLSLGQVAFKDRVPSSVKAPMGYITPEIGYNGVYAGEGTFAVSEVVAVDPRSLKKTTANEVAHYFFATIYPECTTPACHQIDEAASDSMSSLVAAEIEFTRIIDFANPEDPEALENQPGYAATATRLASLYRSQTGDGSLFKRLDAWGQKAHNADKPVERGIGAGLSREMEPAFEVTMSRREAALEQHARRRAVRQQRYAITGLGPDQYVGLFAAHRAEQHAFYDRLDAGDIPYLDSAGEIFWVRGEDN